MFAHEHDKVLLKGSGARQPDVWSLRDVAGGRELNGANKRWVFVTGDGFCCTGGSRTGRDRCDRTLSPLDAEQAAPAGADSGVVGTQSVAHARAIENFVDIAKNTPFIVKTPCSAFDEETGKRCEGLEDEYDFTGDQIELCGRRSVQFYGVDGRRRPHISPGRDDRGPLISRSSMARVAGRSRRRSPAAGAVPLREIEKTHPNDEDRAGTMVMAPCQFIESSLNDVHAEWKEKNFKPELVHCPAGRSTAGQFCLACRVPSSHAAKNTLTQSRRTRRSHGALRRSKECALRGILDGVAAIKLWPLLDDVVNRWQLWQHYRQRDQHNCSAAPRSRRKLATLASSRNW